MYKLLNKTGNVIHNKHLFIQSLQFYTCWGQVQGLSWWFDKIAATCRLEFADQGDPTFLNED